MIYYANYLPLRCHHGIAHYVSLGLFLGALDTGRLAIDVEVPCLRNPSVRHFEQHGC